MKSLNDIETKNILVVGDVMIDTYYTGEVKRISPEAPVPVFRKRNERSVLGGAANVAANLITAEQNVSMMTIIGNDNNGQKIEQMFRHQGINTDLIFSLNRNTTEKIRFLTDRNQQVLRLDIENTEPLNCNDCELLLAKLKAKISEFDLIVVSDYMKGLLTYEFTQGVLQLAHENNISVIVDVKDSNTSKYEGADLVKPNLKELQDLTGRIVSSKEDIIEASKYLGRKCNCKYVLTTCGAHGMVLISDEEPYFINAVGREVFDVTGAGDTAIAYLAACIVNGFSIKESVDFANCAAGIQISKVGTSMVYWQEIRQYLSDYHEEFIHKIISGKAVDDFRKRHKNERIVFTNGCFDIMHVGHIRYLQEAARLGDVLVVGLNSDDSVKRLKGSDRPINSEQERAELISAYGFVDYVIIFEEDTPLEVIKKIKPNVLVKGGDYSGEYVIGTKEVEEYGGRLVLIPFVLGKSTTNIIKKIKNKTDRG